MIRGNAAILKCSIPSFVAEFVEVLSWQDNQGNTYSKGSQELAGDWLILWLYDSKHSREFGAAAVVAQLGNKIGNRKEIYRIFIVLQSWRSIMKRKLFPSTWYAVMQLFSSARYQASWRNSWRLTRGKAAMGPAIECHRITVPALYKHLIINFLYYTIPLRVL